MEEGTRRASCDSGGTVTGRQASAARRPEPWGYDKWEKLEVEEEQEEDEMSMPVCSEIPWHQMGPAVDRILDEKYGPWPETITRGRAQELKAAGNAAFKRRDFAGALSAWGRAADIARKVKDDELWSACRANAVQAELSSGGWEAAEALATELLESCPRHEKTLYRRGIARESRGDLRGAKDDFVRVIALNFLNCEAQDALTRVEGRLRGEGP